MSAPAAEPYTEAEMLRLSKRAVGKIDMQGTRGATLVTTDEIIAMATTLACLGVVPDKPTKGEPT